MAPVPYLRFNFRGVKLLRIASFCDFRVWSFLTDSATEKKKLLRSETSCCLEIKNERTNMLKLPINARTRRNDSVTAHTWPYKRFLSSARILRYKRDINEDSLSVQELAAASPQCWFAKVIVRASPFFQFVTSQITSRSKFSRVAAEPRKLKHIR